MAQQAADTPSRAAIYDATDDVIRVENLHVHFNTALGTVRALNGVSFNIPRGKVLGVVGESGSGKSITGLAIIQLVPRPGEVKSGTIHFREVGEEATDLLRLDRHGDAMRHIRGNNISMIFQEPMTSLNPVFTIGAQIEEAILLHQTQNHDEARRRAVDILDKVGMPNPERIADSYPHQLSGGMRQRTMIALALSCTPTLLIADEPTTALDVTTEAQILELMRDLQDEIGTSIMFITHNMGVVAQMCDEVAVMYLGRIVERATVDEIFYDPKHPYTISLLRSIPRLGQERHGKLEVIKGSVPDPYSSVSGCPFHPRCPSFMPGVCDMLVPEETIVDGNPRRTVRCHLYPGSTGEAVMGGTSGLMPVQAAAYRDLLASRAPDTDTTIPGPVEAGGILTGAPAEPGGVVGGPGTRGNIVEGATGEPSNTLDGPPGHVTGGTNAGGKDTPRR